MQEALQQVRDDLGEQAVILNTRQIRRNNRFNTGEEARVEVMAALDDSAAPAKEPPSPAVRPSAGVSRLAAQRYGAHSAVNEPMDVMVTVYDVMGREISVLVNEQLHPGYHQFIWDGTDKKGMKAGSGLYFIMVQTPEITRTMKATLLR